VVQPEVSRIWEEYLTARGHRVERPADLLVSRNNRRKRFYWLLFSSARARKTFRKAELSHIETLLSRSKQEGRNAYVVVCFSRPERKFVAASAQYVLENKELYADKGGVFL
jgi:Fe-S oxidoreductase